MARYDHPKRVALPHLERFRGLSSHFTPWVTSKQSPRFFLSLFNLGHKANVISTQTMHIFSLAPADPLITTSFLIYFLKAFLVNTSCFAEESDMPICIWDIGYCDSSSRKSLKRTAVGFYLHALLNNSLRGVAGYNENDWVDSKLATFLSLEGPLLESTVASTCFCDFI